MKLKTLVVLLHMSIAVVASNSVRNDCPDKGRAHHGEWHLKIDDTDEVTCELTCHNGYSIRGCHSITKVANGQWSHDIPTCEKEKCAKGKSILEDIEQYMMKGAQPIIFLNEICEAISSFFSSSTKKTCANSKKSKQEL